MYVDLPLLFLIYAFSCIALGVSVYALWTLSEVLTELRKKPKSNNAWDHYHNKAKEIKRPKSHWN